MPMGRLSFGQVLRHYRRAPAGDPPAVLVPPGPCLVRLRSSIPWRSALIPIGLVLIATLVRIVLLGRSDWMVEGDEAMTGLLAKHILEGERPVFLPGHPYQGTFQAYAAALLYDIVGMSRVVLRAVPLIESLVLVVATYWLAHRVLSSFAAALAGLLAAVPPMYVAVNTLRAWPGYTEIMALGNVLLAVTVGVAWGKQVPPWSGWLLGALAGFMFWLHPIAISYLATAALVILIQVRARALRLLLPAVGGFALGAVPIWVGNLVDNFETFRFLTAGPSGDQDSGAVASHFLHESLPRVLGMWQPWGEMPGVVSWLVGGILAAGTVALLARGRKSHGRRLSPSDVPMLFAVVMACVFVFSGFGGPALNPWGFDATGRYVVPLWSVAPLAVGALTEAGWRWWKPLAPLLIGIVLAGFVIGYTVSDPAKALQSVYWNKLPFRSNDLISYLRANDIGHVWMNHWAGFPIMFDAEETIIAADYFDVYVGGGLNRFPQHFAALERAERPAYVLVTDELEPKLEMRLRELGVTFGKTRVGPYVVIRPLSRRVHPAEVTDAIGFEY
ncbi:MAG: hypothetical protein GEU73_01405 [Chloroflexi bacterium]|nr:hypothetical protein [Chloroflexota bacterium]